MDIVKDRDREYRRYSEELRDKVFSDFYLMESQIMRTSYLKIRNTLDWFSMGLLHHLGLRNTHIGFFEGISRGCHQLPCRIRK